MASERARRRRRKIWRSCRLRPRKAAQKRDQQLNIKVTEDCKRVFAEIRRVQGMKAAALFEDMVAERAELLAKAGLLEV